MNHSKNIVRLWKNHKKVKKSQKFSYTFFDSKIWTVLALSTLYYIVCQKKSTLDSPGSGLFFRFSEKSNGHAQKILLLLSSQTGYRPLLHRSFFWRRSSRFFKNSRTEKCNWGWIFCIIAKFQNKNKIFSCFYQRLRIPYEKHFITQR